MDALLRIEELINMTIENDFSQPSSIDTNSIHNIGELFCHSWFKPKNPEAEERKKTVKKVARRAGCKVSYDMVYSDYKNWDILEEARREIMTKCPDMLVSPVTWIPTKKFGYNKCCFGFLPHIEKENNSTYTKGRYPLTKEILETSTYPMQIRSNDGEYYLSENSDDMWKIYTLADDSEYPSNLSSKDFAKSVLNNFKVTSDEYDDKRGVIISKENIGGTYEAYRVLRKRLNTSSFVGLTTDDEMVFDMMIYTIDNNQIDTLTGRHDLFMLDNYFEVWDFSKTKI